jgi:hypothetical protein
LRRWSRPGAGPWGGGVSRLRARASYRPRVARRRRLVAAVVAARRAVRFSAFGSGRTTCVMVVRLPFGADFFFYFGFFN